MTAAHPPQGADSYGRWYGAVIARLNEVCRLPSGWNGYGAGPVHFATALYALRLLEAVCASDTTTPSIVPGIDGDLQIEWHRPRCHIELHVRAPGDVHAWRETPDTGPDGEELLLTETFTPIAAWLHTVVEPADGRAATAA